MPYGSTLWHERIQFKEVLLKNKNIAHDYNALKISLAKEFADDREAYALCFETRSYYFGATNFLLV